MEEFQNNNIKKIIFSILDSGIQIDKEISLSTLDIGKKSNISKKNISGDVQKELDIICNDIIISNLKKTKCVNIIASEENENPVLLDCESQESYAVVFDPIDGSGNIDCHASLGTIFGIYKSCKNPDLEILLQRGRDLISSGYILYSSSTILVLTIKEKVRSFTLDRFNKKFIENNFSPVKLPVISKKIISANVGNKNDWSEKYLKIVERNNYSYRYFGGLVPDIHRTILYGGVFLYPEDKKNKNGKLRIVYECNPVSFLLEKLGINCYSSNEKILNIKPDSLHQKISFLAEI